MLKLMRVATTPRWEGVRLTRDSVAKECGPILLNPAYVVSVTPLTSDYPLPVYRVAMAHDEVWTVAGDALADLDAWLAVLAKEPS